MTSTDIDAVAAPTARLLQELTQTTGFSDATLVASAPDTIRLLAGVPDRSALPTDAFARAYGRLQHDPDRLIEGFQYSNAQGIPELREWIATREGVSADRILVTAGGQHGLSLVVRAFVDEGDLVAVDNPIWPLFLGILELKSRNILPIPVEADGIDVSALEQQLRAGRRIRALYTVPDFHNPTQGSLSEEKRRHLVRLADEYGFWLIADNPYRELHFGERGLDTSVFHESPNTVHVNTFSKTLGPGLRLGWIVLPERTVADVVRLRNRNDSQTSTLTQTLVAEVLNGEPAFFDDNLVRARSLYRSRAEGLVAALDRHLPGAFETTVPSGGYFLWARLADDSADWQELYARAAEHGLSYQPGAFFASGPGTDADRHLRLAYGDNTVERIDEGVERLAAAYHSLS
ncbi:aminotransferase-like domain-containing protein [Pseudoclavibacter sp. 13-3]|uniref:aminotransferase-like domain-containing protein n=1 Tax=Pseudoclavibacter sp. 13-3 TaxID=2901228 RepID=UPI001E3F15D6|nr:PLP-dependent aminotransferase family protein [Pseudoclavibacter sp. 13-3]MCD7101424.1 PLP-dependent aminotransferase family protein [Pseudoclavibacter sp. 13-3]